MKQLYKWKLEYTLKSTTKELHTTKESSMFYYGELPKTTELTFSPEEIMAGETAFCIHSPLFGKEHKISFYFDSETVKQSELLYAKCVRKFQLVNAYSYTFEDLMKKLSATEFIDWCKDNGLTVCPIGK